VTSLLQFARSVGNTVGTAIFGSILTLRFAPEMQAALPDEIEAGLPDSVLALTQTPQALVDPAQSESLRAALAQAAPEATELVFAALRSGLAGSLQWVFLAAAFVFGLGMVASLFMREVPLVGKRGAAPVSAPSPDLARSGRTETPPALTA
jgi:hypothetical protein